MNAGEARGGRLALAKVAPPVRPAGDVDRSHILLPAIESDDVSVVTITAPAGSGKTVLLAQTARRLGGPTRSAWLKLDETDNDEVRFWEYARLAVGLDAFEVDDPGIVDPAAGFSRVLSELGGPTVLVLDDYHVVTNADIHRAVDRLVGLLPPGAMLVIAGRSQPRLSSARWLIQGQLVELHAADLAFSESDAASFLVDGLGVELDADDVKVLVERTRGWAAGLRVAGLSLRHVSDPSRFVEDFAGDHHHLVDYFGSEVLERQPSELRDFLLDTALLDELSAATCDAVTRSNRSAGLLRRLATTGLFVDPLDETWTRYACHPLFREMLVSRLRAERPADEARLHRRAASWFAQTGEVERYVGHLIAAGDEDEALQVIVREWIKLSNGGRHGIVWRWLAALSPTVLQRDPQLAVMAAWTRLNERDYGDIERWLDPAGSTLTDAGLRSEALVIRSHRWRHLGDTVAACEAAAEAVGAAPLDDDLRQAAARAALGAALYWVGHNDDARQQLERAVECGNRAGEHSSVVLGLMYQACLDRTDGVGSVALANQALELADESSDFHVPAMAHLALAQQALDERRLRDALRALDEVERFSQQGREPLQLTVAAALRARVLHVLGDAAAARRELRTAFHLLRDLPEPGVAVDAVHRATADLRFAPRESGTVNLVIRPLTNRELTLLRLLDSELTRQQIADELFVSLATVKTHLHSIARKLGVSRRGDIVERARSHGLLPDVR